MKFLIIADPVESLKPKGDTGLSLLREALKRGHSVYWALADDLELDHAKLYINAKKALSCAPGELPAVSAESERLLIPSFDSVWIRKDPPFDQSYVSLCWLLALEEENVLMINKPSLLLRFHEKMLPLEAFKRGFVDEKALVPTYLSMSGARWGSPAAFDKEVVDKPWLGFGGNDVRRWQSVSRFEESVPLEQRKHRLFQPFLEQVNEVGDRRVMFLDGEYVADFVRLPKEGSFLSNLAQGGSAELRPLTATEQALIPKLGRFLKQVGIFNAGVDFVADYLTEINITAPTGFETAAKLSGLNPAVKYLDLVEKRLK